MSVAPRSVSKPVSNPVPGPLAGPIAGPVSVEGPVARPVQRTQEAAHPGSPGATILGVGVTWRLTRRSLGDRAPGGTSRLLEMAVRVEGLGTARVSASVVATDPASGESVVLVVAVPDGVGAEVIADIRSQVHIECPGVLHATIAGGRDGWRLVYARTPVLAELGVPGGRAEPVGVSVRTA